MLAGSNYEPVVSNDFFFLVFFESGNPESHERHSQIANRDAAPCIAIHPIPIMYIQDPHPIPSFLGESWYGGKLSPVFFYRCRSLHLVRKRPFLVLLVFSFNIQSGKILYSNLDR